MTSRQRVLAALNHRGPGRVPIDFSRHRSSGIAPLACARLRHALGLKGLRSALRSTPALGIVEENVLHILGG
jgi:uroporphyrinogen decarboxylase